MCDDNHLSPLVLLKHTSKPSKTSKLLLNLQIILIDVETEQNEAKYLPFFVKFV